MSEKEEKTSLWEIAMNAFEDLDPRSDKEKDRKSVV